jgi:hypothetical protein
MTVVASPLGRLQLCGSELANKLAEICSVQGYNDPFRNSMYYGECKSSITTGVHCTVLPSKGVPEKSNFPKAADHMGHPYGCHKTFFFFSVSKSYHFQPAVAYLTLSDTEFSPRALGLIPG